MPWGYWGAVPGGAGLPLLWGASGVRRCPSAGRPSSGAGRRGSATRVSRVRSVRVWGPSTGPTARALAGRRCAPWGRRKGVPGGGAVRRCEGRLGLGAPPPPAARTLGGLPGPTTHWLWVRGGAGVGTRHQPHSARSCELALRAVGAARGCPGGAPLAWVWDVRGRVLSQPPLPALWAGCRGPLPTGCGCGGLRAWGPVTNPTARALACCGGGMRVPGGGASCLRVGRPGSGALPPPTARPLGGLPAPTTHWLWVRGGAGVGTRHQPHRARSCELAFRAVGAARGRLEGGASCLGVGRPGSGTLPSPTARPLGGLPGPTTHWLWVRGGCGRGDPSPTPQRALLRPVGGGMRVPGGGVSCLGVGRPGSGALPPPTARPLSGLPGPTTHWLWVRGGAGVGTRHQPHSARSCVLWGRHEGARGGRLLPGCGRSGVGRSPSPDCPLSGRAAGAHYPLAVGAGGCGRGDPSPTPQRALLRAGFALCGSGMKVPVGGASCLGVGRPESGALPTPTARPLGRLPGPATHWLWVRGGAGVGTRHQPHSARSCELALRAVGAARGCPVGASCLGVGRPGSGTLPSPTARPLGGLPGPTTHWLWVRGGAGVGTRHQPHSARSCVLLGAA